MDVKNSLFLTEYKNQSIKALLSVHPEWDEEKLEKIIDEIIEKKFMNPSVTLDNNYTHENKDTTLLSVLDWALEKKPIIAGNGTFYRQHSESINPIANMVDGFLEQRKQFKKQMFAVGDESSSEYKDFDLKQQNMKILANSYYGASGMKSSPFYSLWSGPATTSSAQSVISTAETTFEAFLGDNVIFIDFNECIHWINTVLSEEDNKLEDWIVRVNLDDTYGRLSDSILGITESDKEFLYDYLKTLSIDEITRLFYKNNLIEFTKRHEYIKDIHDKVFSSIKNYEYMEDENDIEKIPKNLYEKFNGKEDIVKDWNAYVDKNYFYDPNDIPDSVIEYLEELSYLYKKYVYVRFLWTDRIYRLRNFQRNVVTVIDTDSNILSLDTWMEYCIENLMKSDYGRDKEKNIYIAINSITYIITNIITDILLYYGEMSNVEEKIRPRYNMKNEFFFARLIIAKTKKRYLSKIVLREGHRLKKPKMDVKGFDFKKATTSEEAEKKYMHIIEDLLLNPDEIDLASVYKELVDFKKEIYDSLRRGERRYLPNSTAKELEAYADPSTNQGVRGVLAWNMCEPDQMIEFPAKVSLLKMNAETLEDIESMKTKYPDKYEAIYNGIFNDKSSIFIKPKKNSKGELTMTCTGMKVLAIPTNTTIPEWAMDYIDYTTVINDILAPFKSVLETFGLNGIEQGRTGRKTTGLSNIIKL